MNEVRQWMCLSIIKNIREIYMCVNHYSVYATEEPHKKVINLYKSKERHDSSSLSYVCTNIITLFEFFHESDKFHELIRVIL